MGRLRAITMNGHGQSGYSLIGTAIMILVIGMFSVAGIAVYQQYSWTEKSEKTNVNLEIVKNALVQYKALNGRLPCPARFTSSPTTSEFGVETNCGSGPITGATFEASGRGGAEISFGAVPVRTLNIQEGAAFDGWNHRIVYAVTRDYTSATPPSDNEDGGAIYIVDGGDNDATSESGNVVYTLLAPGSDTRGAYSIEGELINDCDPANGENCDYTNATLRSNMLRQWGGTDEYTSKLNYSASAVAYEWVVPPWGPCNNNQQTRNEPTCVVKGTSTPAPGKCGDLIKPVTQQTCRDEYWHVVDPACPDTCGPPQSVAIDVSCRQRDGVTIIPDSQCLQSVGAKPPTSKVCTFTYNPCPTWQNVCPSCGGVPVQYSSSSGYSGGGSSGDSGGRTYYDSDGDGIGDTTDPGRSIDGRSLDSYENSRGSTDRNDGGNGGGLGCGTLGTC